MANKFADLRESDASDSEWAWIIIVEEEAKVWWVGNLACFANPKKFAQSFQRQKSAQRKQDWAVI